ncbi:MAG: hypothetical protein FWC27_11025 [Firmicutes bacterium]|nr:hypothetical protein [Bacillota bacterium]
MNNNVRILGNTEYTNKISFERANANMPIISTSVLADCQQNFKQHQAEYEQRFDILENRATKFISLMKVMHRKSSYQLRTGLAVRFLNAMIDYRQEIDTSYNLVSILLVLAAMIEKEFPGSLGEKNSEHYDSLKDQLRTMGDRIDQSLREWIEQDYMR